MARAAPNLFLRALGRQTGGTEAHAGEERKLTPPYLTRERSRGAELRPEERVCPAEPVTLRSNVQLARCPSKIRPRASNGDARSAPGIERRCKIRPLRKSNPRNFLCTSLGNRSDILHFPSTAFSHYARGIPGTSAAPLLVIGPSFLQDQTPSIEWRCKISPRASNGDARSDHYARAIPGTSSAPLLAIGLTSGTFPAQPSVITQEESQELPRHLSW